MSARIRFRQRITQKKTCVFFCRARSLDCWRFARKQLTSGDKKTISKKTSLFQKIKNFFPAMFFCLFIRRPPFFKKMVKSCFYFVALINFSRNLSTVFFISSPSLTFPKTGSMFFFLDVFFFAFSLDFSDLKQMNKT